LGKNPRLAYAVKLLARESSIRVINQVHDFPEDNRPAQLHALRYCTGQRDDQFWREICYYDRPNVIWATLTTHDAAKLAACGVPAHKIHVLPNPIGDEFFSRPAISRTETLEKLVAYAQLHRYPFDPCRPILLSPMKVMVRKNNEEAIELTKRLGKYQLVISLDASSPSDCAYSERLKRKIRRERLPVVIGAGCAFIEGWLRNKLVLGRDLPEVTTDFVAAGMDLRHLYRELDDHAVQRIARLWTSAPRTLIERNRRIVVRQYSLAAYARRYEKLLASKPSWQ